MSVAGDIERPDFDPGVYFGLPEDEYRFARGVSVTTLHKIAVSPAHYKVQRDHPRPPTPALHFGRAFHALMLQPELFYSQFRPDPFPGSTAKAANAARERLAEEGFTVIQTSRDGAAYWDRDDWAALHNAREAVMADPLLRVLMMSGEPEVSAFWMDPIVGRKCKARIDWYNEDHRIGLEFKSADDGSYSGFQRAVKDRRYHVQDAYFLDGMAEAGHRLREMIFVVVEKAPPYAVTCYTLSHWRREGRILYRRDLRTYEDCTKRDYWPPYPTDIRALDMPGYAKLNRIS